MKEMRIMASVSTLALSALLMTCAMPTTQPDPAPDSLAPSAQFPTIELPPGFRIEKVVGDLTYPTSITWDDQGQMYVAEAGGQFRTETAPPRILRVELDHATEVVNLARKGKDKAKNKAESKVKAKGKAKSKAKLKARVNTKSEGVADPVVGLTWYKGEFYFTHRDPQDRTGAISRVTSSGKVTRLISGLLDSRFGRQIADIEAGPDGLMYVGTSSAGSSAVIGPDLAPFVKRSPDMHATACQDIVLTGENFETPDFRTPDPSDKTLTGAYVPFGTVTKPGQRITGTKKCGGAVLAFDPADPEKTLRTYAWGFGNVAGIGWNKVTGEMYVSAQGYDLRGPRPVKEEYDATYRVREGVWYGWPDFSAVLEPLTYPKFEPPDDLQATVVLDGQPQGKRLGFLIDHAASKLMVASGSLVFGLHDFGSSPSMLDIAPPSWGEELVDHVFVAEWGDRATSADPLLARQAGYEVVQIGPAGGGAEPFVRNVKPGPASAQGAAGRGLERPIDVKFGPDGALYIVDSGVARVDPARAAEHTAPYEFVPHTGAIWKVTQLP